MPDDKWVQRTAVEYTAAFNSLLPTGPAWPRTPSEPIQEVVAGLMSIWGTEVEALAALLLQTESDPRSANILLPDWETAFGLPDICNPVPPTNIAQRQINLVTKMTLLGSQSRAFFIAQAANIGQTVTIREYAPYMCGVSQCGDTSLHNSDLPGNFTGATNATTSTSSAVISLVSVNPSIIPGMLVTDTTTNSVVGIVKSVSTATNTVTMQNSSLSAIGNGDGIYFSNFMRWQLGPPEMRFYWMVRIQALLANFTGADVTCIFSRWKPAHTIAIFDFSPLQDLDQSLPWDSGFAGIL